MYLYPHYLYILSFIILSKIFKKNQPIKESCTQFIIHTSHMKDPFANELRRSSHDNIKFFSHLKMNFSAICTYHYLLWCDLLIF